jgi:FtsZ-binding cell division protein ZapB
VHVLTKVFVVIAALLAAALSTLVIAYAVNTDRIASDYRNVLAQNTAVNAKIADMSSQAATEKANLAARLQDETNANTQLQGQLTALQSERATLLSEKNKADAARQSIEAKIAELGETVKVQSSIIEALRSENSTLRQNELNFRQQALDMESRMADLESQKEVLDQRFRALSEQLAEMKRQTDATLSGAAPASAGMADQPFEYRGPVIKGTVDEVQKDAATQKMMARINVGTNDRVAKNMKFAVIRNNAFICNLVVEQVDMKWSLAAVNTLGKNVAVQPGDLILSRLEP